MSWRTCCTEHSEVIHTLKSSSRAGIGYRPELLLYLPALYPSICSKRIIFVNSEVTILSSVTNCCTVSDQGCVSQTTVASSVVTNRVPWAGSEQIKRCFKTLLTSLVTDHVMAQFTSVENINTKQKRKLWLTGAKSCQVNML